IGRHAEIPTSGTMTATPMIKGSYDKVKGALVVVETESVDPKGRPLFRNTAGIFARGEGGFGGDRGPSGPRNLPPDRPPDKSIAMKTLPQQALLYRLSGDMNPLHADPDFAKLGGYDRPILHGLCTYGHAARAAQGAPGRRPHRRRPSPRSRRSPRPSSRPPAPRASRSGRSASGGATTAPSCTSSRPCSTPARA